jgi:hypothetical protein
MTPFATCDLMHCIQKVWPMQNVPFMPATDPLGYTAPLDQRATYPLLGVPLEVRSNSPAVIAAAERAFGGWRGLEPELIAKAAPLVVSLIVHRVDDRLPMTNEESRTNGQRTADMPFIQRFHSDCFLATDGANLLTAQFDRGRALGFVTPELVADEAQLRYHALELLALLLVTRDDRTPVHAGAVVRKGRAVLLVGRSMAGKSTLCYACLRDGFQLLAEDVVYVSWRCGMRLWGMPWRIHLLPDAVRYFAELADIPAAIQANGKLKLAVETTMFGADRQIRHVERAVVCMVDRRPGRSSVLEPIDPGIPIMALSRDLESGFDLHGDTRGVAEALVAGGAYRLHVGSDLAGAVALLKELTDE